jgi:hypothetical protein
MASSKALPSSRKGVTLTAKFSLLLVLAVIIPLGITVFGSEVILRPTLVNQATTEMGNDAQSHMQDIDALLVARVQDVDYISRYLAIQNYLVGETQYKAQATAELKVGTLLDPNYGDWTLFNTQSQILLSYPDIPAPRGTGSSQIPSSIVSQLQSPNKSVISDVYFDTTKSAAFVDIYASITDANSKLLGFARSTFYLTDIWTVVNDESNSAPGSYAMIVDGNGVRIAYTNPDTTLTTFPKGLFQSIGTISPSLENTIQSENLYGNNTRSKVTEIADPSLQNIQSDTSDTASTWSFQPTLQNGPSFQSFQAYQVKSAVVPWTFIELRPLNSITGPATQQDIYLVVIAAIVMLLAAIVGILLGRTITRPILQSAALLSGSSEMLNTLAAREQVTATEQKWIVESSQTALQSVQYYTEATSIAARKLDEVGSALSRNLEEGNAAQARRHLSEILEAAKYLEKVAVHQERSSQSLSTAIRIASQVTEQLISGATSANDAAAQLQAVIKQLRQIVGNEEGRTSK